MNWTQEIQQLLTQGAQFADAPGQGQFPIDPALTGMVVAYKNTALIADRVMPYVPATGRSFKYEVYPIGTHYTVPQTLVGRVGQPNMVSLSSEGVTAQVEDHGLMDLVSIRDIQEYGRVGIDPVARSAEHLWSLVLLARELRVARMVATPENYGSTTPLEAAERFSAAGSDPIKVISDALDKPLLRPNAMVMGRKVFSVLARHPDILQAVNRSDGDKGVARRADIAALFDVEEIHVGEALVNIAAEGQPANLQRAWGQDLALLHLDATASLDTGMTWGVTARWQQPVAGQIPHPVAGLYGGVFVKAGESVVELVRAPHCGHLIVGAVD